MRYQHLLDTGAESDSQLSVRVFSLVSFFLLKSVYREKQDYVTQAPTAAAEANSATSLTENREVLPVIVRANELARKTKKSNKKSLR